MLLRRVLPARSEARHEPEPAARHDTRALGEDANPYRCEAGDEPPRAGLPFEARDGGRTRDDFVGRPYHERVCTASLLLWSLAMMTRSAGWLLWALVLTPWLAGASEPLPSTDDVAVRDVVRRYVDAREAQDPKAVEGLLTRDADQLVSDGTWRRGRDDLVQGMLASSRKNPARRSIKVESVRFLAPDVAMADGRYTQAGGSAVKDRQMWTTIVLKREGQNWKIAAIRNMLPAPPPSEPASK